VLVHNCSGIEPAGGFQDNQQTGFKDRRQ